MSTETVLSNDSKLERDNSTETSLSELIVKNVTLNVTEIVTESVTVLEHEILSRESESDCRKDSDNLTFRQHPETVSNICSNVFIDKPETSSAIVELVLPENLPDNQINSLPERRIIRHPERRLSHQFDRPFPVNCLERKLNIAGTECSKSGMYLKQEQW